MSFPAFLRYLRKHGYVLPSYQPYDCRGLFDYGPQGSLFKKHLQDLWEQSVVNRSPIRAPIFRTETPVLTPPIVLEASHHHRERYTGSSRKATDLVSGEFLEDVGGNAEPIDVTGSGQWAVRIEADTEEQAKTWAEKLRNLIIKGGLVYTEGSAIFVRIAEIGDGYLEVLRDEGIEVTDSDDINDAGKASPSTKKEVAEGSEDSSEGDGVSERYSTGNESQLLKDTDDPGNIKRPEMFASEDPVKSETSHPTIRFSYSGITNPKTGSPFVLPKTETTSLFTTFRNRVPPVAAIVQSIVDHIKPILDNPDSTKAEISEYLTQVIHAKLGSAEMYLRPDLSQAAAVNYRHIVHDLGLTRPPFGVVQIGKVFQNLPTVGKTSLRTYESTVGGLSFYSEPENWENDLRLWREHFLEFWHSLSPCPGRWKTSTKSQGGGAQTGTEKPPSQSVIVYDGFPWIDKYPCEIETLTPLGDEGLRSQAGMTTEMVGPASEVEGRQAMDGALPYVTHASTSIDRAILALLWDSFVPDKELVLGADMRVIRRPVLTLHPRLSPYKALLVPYHPTDSKQVLELAREFDRLRIPVDMNHAQTVSLGRKFFHSDAIGTPFVLLVDGSTVRARYRDTGHIQKGLSLSDAIEFVQSRVYTHRLRNNTQPGDKAEGIWKFPDD